MPEAIVHEYQAQNQTEQGKLDELAVARCKVVLRKNESQPHMGGVTLVFMKDKTVPLAVLEILSWDHKGLTELTKPMQELELWNLAEIWEVDAPYVRPTLSKEAAISSLEANNCRVNSNVSNSVLWVYNMNNDRKIIITVKDKREIVLNPGDHKDNLIATDIVDVHWNYT